MEMAYQQAVKDIEKGQYTVETAEQHIGQIVEERKEIFEVVLS